MIPSFRNLLQRKKAPLESKSEASAKTSGGPSFMDHPLLHFTPHDPLTVRLSMQGIQVWGGIGSGKTSGSGAALARAFLRAGYGGLVCCSKPEERKLWEHYCAETGRTDDLIIIEPGDPAPYRFNFLDYELRRQGRGGGQTENVVALLAQVAEIIEGKTTPHGGERFWTRAGQQLLRNAVEMLLIATGGASLQSVIKLVLSAPDSPEQTTDADWQQESILWQALEAGEAAPKTARQTNDYDRAVDYWMEEYPALDPKTRAGIVSTFTGMADLLTHGLAWELLCHDTNIVPDVAWRSGAIIVLDVPIQEFHEVGRVVQSIWKFMYQRTIIGRDVEEYPRPCVLWCDEAQNFISSFDFKYQEVSRSALSATVFLSQNINGYYARMGDNRSATDALLGNFQLQIFHANADHLTNKYAADKIAQSWQTIGSYSASRDQQGSGSMSSSGAEQLHYRVQPGEFINLRTGGPDNDLQVDGVLFKSGNPWRATGENHVKISFTQQ